ncbi:MAG: ATP-NAD kinase family protein [Candidatus Bathyarchaeia archaeon]
MKTIGLIVNPIAGIGGAVGLKGSDGSEILRKALSLGGRASAPEKSITFMNTLKTLTPVKLIVGAGLMGQQEALNCGLNPTQVIGYAKENTTAEDTKETARKMAHIVDLLTFCGGDGTARDIMDAVDLDTVVLGIPGGVKLQSAVFAVTPQSAALIAHEYLEGRLEVVEREVVDIDEEAFRMGVLKSTLYGYLRVPEGGGWVQPMKSPSDISAYEVEQLKSIAKYVVEELDDEHLYILGPGTTVKAICDHLGLPKTLLGVDVLRNSRILKMDVNENDLLELLEGGKGKIIITPIGGQGHIFGRGNQQISSRVIRRVGKENIIVVATPSKLGSIQGGRLLVDTGDPDLDTALRGYVRVVVGYREEKVMRVE